MPWEHLLLLPRNAPLFADSRLHTIVLDEIHTYAGALAIEVAYLLRKLRNCAGYRDCVDYALDTTELDGQKPGCKLGRRSVAQELTASILVKIPLHVTT
jgi:hypothetical protein